MSSGTIWDGGNVKLSVDDGPFEVIPPRDGYDGTIDTYNTVVGGEPGFGGTADGSARWRPEIIDLTEYIGHAVKIEFHFGSDDNTSEVGWYVDDMELLTFPLSETGVCSDKGPQIKTFTLQQNYPNPFNNRTKIEYYLPVAALVQVSIYNRIGQRVKMLTEGHQTAGAHFVYWEGATDTGELSASGLYFCQIKMADKTLVRKMLHLK